MKTRVATWLAAGVLFLSVEAMAAPPPASAFAALPEMSMVRLSPNGQRVAWANDPGGSPLVVVFDLATGKDLKRLRPANSRVRDLDWADDRMLIISVSRSLTAGATTVAEQRYEFERYLALDVEDPRRHAKSLLMEHPDRELVSGASLERLHPEKPGTVIMSTYNFSGTAYREEIGSRISGGRKDSGWELALFEVDIKSGKGRMIESGSPYTDEWILDAAGRPVARSEWNPESRRYTILAKRGESWQSIYTAEIDYEFHLAGLSADGASLLARSPRGSDRFKVWTIPLSGGEPSLLYEHPRYDVTLGAVRPLLRRADRLLGRRPEPDDGLDRPEARIDPEGHLQGLRGKDHLRSSTAPPTTSASSPKSRARPARPCTTWSTSARVPPTSSARPIRRSPTRRSVRSVHELQGAGRLRDTRLPDAAARARAESRCRSSCSRTADRTRATWETSTGGPNSSRRAATSCCSRSSGVRRDSAPSCSAPATSSGAAACRTTSRPACATSSTGAVVDPKRVCIVGGSYGGYAALAGAAFTPDLYACAISVNGVTDIPQMAGFIRERGRRRFGRIPLVAGPNRRSERAGHHRVLAEPLRRNHPRADPADPRDQRYGRAAVPVAQLCAAPQAAWQGPRADRAAGRGPLAVDGRVAPDGPAEPRNLPRDPPALTLRAPVNCIA